MPPLHILRYSRRAAVEGDMGSALLGYSKCGILTCDMFACAHVNEKSSNLTKRAARKKAFSKGEKGDRLRWMRMF